MTQNNSYKTYSIITSCVIVAVIIGSIVFFNSKKNNAEQDIVNNNPWSQESRARLGIDEGSSTTNDFNFTKEYTNTMYNFSFLYPQTYTATTFFDAVQEADVVLVQHAEQGSGFQIQITPFDENIRILTAQRVKQDLPTLVMADVQEVDLGEYGKGIAFMSNNENFGGSSREVWFVWNKNLYQVSTYKHLDTVVQAVMNTWTFR